MVLPPLFNLLPKNILSLSLSLSHTHTHTHTLTHTFSFIPFISKYLSRWKWAGWTWLEQDSWSCQGVISPWHRSQPNCHTQVAIICLFPHLCREEADAQGGFRTWTGVSTARKGHLMPSLPLPQAVLSSCGSSKAGMPTSKGERSRNLAHCTALPTA